MEDRMATGHSAQNVLEAAKVIEGNRLGIVLTGTIKNGKVEIDKACLDELAKKFPNATKSFVAVNAPFDPKAIPVS
ncbi:MAG: hypothetical protein WCQ57_15165 [Verrucomicrobiota bacterium]|jgi:hypothetical protein